jgi:type II secretory ATPase GspE/PulE/Tfp pilus assembly ATPase PilB-like protein
MYCREHFPHVIEFVLKQKGHITQQTIDISLETESEGFFSDTEKTIPNVDNILTHSLKINASDIHLQAGKCIAYRVEGILIQMTDYPILTEKHLDTIKESLLKNHPKMKHDLEDEHDIDF